MLELAGLVNDEEEAEAFRAAALRMLEAMTALCADFESDMPGILTKCTASYNDDGAGRHVNIMYGDYFFVEALLRLSGREARLWFSDKRTGEEA